MRHGHGPRRALAAGAIFLAVTTLGAVGTAASAAAASAGKPPDPALARAVAAWVSGGGESGLDALGSDFSTLEAAANASDLARMSAGCDRLRSDVEMAQQYEPIPDSQAQHDWALALASYARGATDCVAGADTSNANLMTRASSEITSGSAQLDKVTARLNEIAG